MNWSLEDYANTREQALGVWLLALLVLMFVWPQTRTSALAVVRSLGNWKVLASLATYAVFLGCVVWVAWQLGIWAPKLVGATLVWFVVTGLAFYTDAVTKASKTEGFFRSHLRETVRLAALFEFFVNVQTLPLWAELLLLPVLAFLAMMRAFAMMKEETRNVANFLTVVLTVITLGLITFTVTSFVQRPETFVLLDVLRELFLPVWLAALAVPFAYASAVLAGYELMMARLRWFAERRNIPMGVRLGLISALRTNLQAIDRFAGQRGKLAVASGTFGGAREEVKKYLSEVAKDKSDREAARQRLIDFAGVEGVDKNGRRLDRREFQTTKRALEWLAVSHSGHYRQGQNFNREVLSVIGDFEAQGLANPHGIVMKVRADGKAWFAYRQTVPGYYFGIGAVGEPNNQWYYDGERPPSGFPSERGGWSSYSSGIRDEWREESPT